MTVHPKLGRALRASVVVAAAGAALFAGALPAQAAPGAAPAPLTPADECLLPVQDVAIVMDTTGSMGDAISAAQSTAIEAANTIIEAGGKVALVDYKDAGDEYVTHVEQDFTDDPDAFEDATNTMYADGGGDRAEAVLSAIDTAVKDLSWTTGSARAIILITDVDYHDPDVANSALTTETAIAQLTTANIQLFPLLTSSYYADAYTDLVEGAGGSITTIDSAGDSIDEILKQVIDDVVSRPWVRFEPAAFTAEAGAPVTLPTVSGADCKPLDVASWSWTTTDGSPTVTGTPGSSADLTYAEPGEYEVEVTLTTVDGQTATAKTTVTVTAAPATTTPATTTPATTTPATTEPPATTTPPVTTTPATPGAGTTAPTPTDEGGLASTGADSGSIALVVGGAAAVLIAGAALLLLRRRSA